MTTDKIYLVGFMASGKSTIARALAARLRWQLGGHRRAHRSARAPDDRGDLRAAGRAVLPRRSSARSCGSSSRCATSSSRPAAARLPIPTTARLINLDGVSVWIDVPLVDLIPAHSARRPAAARGESRGARAALRRARRRVPARAPARATRRARPRPRSSIASCDAIQQLPPIARRSSTPGVVMSVRYLILSDIHANLHALDAVLADAAAIGYDDVLVLGDLVGYGADPAAVIDADAGARAAWRSFAAITTRSARGSSPRRSSTTWRASSIEWTASALDAERAARRWRTCRKGPRSVPTEHRDLPRRAVRRGLLRVRQARRRARDRGRAARLCLFGHTHVPAVFATRDDPVRDGSGPGRRRVALPAHGPGADQRRIGRPTARRRSARGLRRARPDARHDPAAPRRSTTSPARRRAS